LWDQSLQNFEIVVTDNSDDDEIKRICEYYKTGINYFRNPRKGMAQNTNEAIKRARGELIKILYMDDFLCETEALEIIDRRFYGNWLASGCAHTSDGKYLLKPHIPHYSHDIYTGHNSIGSPSVITIKNDMPLLFDEEMTWLLDCDYYKRMYTKYGAPIIVKDILIGIGIHGGQATNLMGDEIKSREHNYIKNKYDTSK